MKQAPTLEQERRAILDRIHASRAEYRRKLLAAETARRSKPTPLQIIANVPAVRTIGEHPILTAVAVAAVVSVGFAAKYAYDHRDGDVPRLKKAFAKVTAKDRIARILGSVKLQSPITQKTSVPKAGAMAGAGVALASAATMLLSSPMKMRLAGKLFSAALAYGRRRNSAAPPMVRNMRNVRR
jgi:hypothetical protein